MSQGREFRVPMEPGSMIFYAPRPPVFNEGWPGFPAVAASLTSRLRYIF